MKEQEILVRLAAADILMAAKLLDHAVITLRAVTAEPALVDVWSKMIRRARVPLMGTLGPMEDLANILADK